MTDSARNIVAQAYHAYKAGDLETARSLVRQALQLEPENANAWYVVGLVSSEEKNKRRAFEKAVVLDPQHKYARAALEAMTLPLDPADYVAPRPSSPSIPSSPPNTPKVEMPKLPTPKPTATTTSERVMEIANRAAKGGASTKKKSASVGWLLPTLVIMAAIGLVAVIVVVLRSRPATLEQPTAAALAQATLTDAETMQLSETPAQSETPAEAAALTEVAPTETSSGEAVSVETRSSNPSTTTPTVTPTPRPTLNLVTVTPTATRAEDAQLTGQILVATVDDLYSVNMRDASVSNLTNRSHSQIRSGRWSPDRQHILLVANGAVVITDANAGAPRTLDLIDWRAMTAAWSPDGNRIVFIGYNEQRMDDRFLFVINADSTDLRQITPNSRPYDSVDWSADGILYSLSSQSSVGLWSISPDGGEPTLLASPTAPLGVRRSPDGKRILYKTTPANTLNSQLFVFESVTGTIRDFPKLLGSVVAAAWSPDGTRIAYSKQDDSGSGYSIFVLQAESDGESVRIATGLAYPMTLEWTDEGNAVSAPTLVKLPNAEDTILFVKSTDNPVLPDRTHTDIYVLEADGSQRQITNFLQNVTDPVWSPDGAHIAFAAKELARSRDPYFPAEAPSRIYIMNADGSGAYQVTPELPEAERPKFDQTAPSWSPDGLLIAYLHTENAVTSLRVMDTQGALSAGSEIGKFTYVTGRVSWSPDGRRLVLSGTSENTNSGMFVIDVDGSNLRRLTDFPGGQPVLSPDGTRIAFIGRTEPNNPNTALTIYGMDSEGRNPQRLLQDDFEEVSSVAWSADGAVLVFSAKRGSFTDLYLMNADGSGVQALMVDEQADLAPQWKPRGNTQVALAGTSNPNATPIPAPSADGLLAFAGKRGDGLCLAKPDGSDVRCTQENSFVYDLRWSPDGTRLAYVSGSIPATNIYVAEADGTVKQLTTDTRGNTAPAWSPDGQQIAFLAGREGPDQIYVMNADGSDQHALTQFVPSEIRLRYASLAWSPDGKTILFILSPDAGAGGVYRMDVDGSNVRKLNDQDGASVMYSPDGQRVVFVTYNGNNSSVMVMNADGSNVQALTFSAGYNADPAWSPDGQFIVFASTRDNSNPALTPSVYIMGADGTDQHRVGELQGSSPVWTLSPASFELPHIGAN